MLHVTAFVPPERAGEISAGLTALPGVRHLVVGGPTSEGLLEVVAQVDGAGADRAIELLSRFDLAPDDVTMWRVPTVRVLGRRGAGRPAEPPAHAWAKVIDQADRNSRLLTTYLVYMLAAGVIAGVGVLTGSSILVVGAMAISPDLLPISAGAVGLVDRRWRLAGRAGGVLAIGLGAGAAAACATTLVLRLSGRIGDDLVLADTVLGPSLTRFGPGERTGGDRRGGRRDAGLRGQGQRGRRGGHLGDDDPRRCVCGCGARPGQERPGGRCADRPADECRADRPGQHCHAVVPAAPEPQRRRDPARLARLGPGRGHLAVAGVEAGVGASGVAACGRRGGRGSVARNWTTARQASTTAATQPTSSGVR